jgi:trafficking protein particle complex subunit 12
LKSCCQDFAAAVHLLEPLTNQGPGVSTAALRSATARIYLQAGYLAKATQHFVAVEADPESSQEVKDMNAALLASAEGDWPRASELLKGLLVADSDNYVVSYWFYFAHQFMN